MKKQRFTMTQMKAKIPDYAARSFIDVGGHVGLWSMWWQTEVAEVLAYEPVRDLHPIFMHNTGLRAKQGHNVRLFGKALGANTGKLHLVFDPENTGGTYALPLGSPVTSACREVSVLPLDKHLPRVSDRPVGAIKIDCEGAELGVVMGAEITIDRYRPVIIVEQKNWHKRYSQPPTAAADFLRRMDYDTVRVIHGDHIMVPQERMG